MMVNTEALVAMTEANQNFSKATHTVDENGLAVIFRDNKPRYIVMDFEKYGAIKGIREAGKERLEMTIDALIEENMEVFLELTR